MSSEVGYFVHIADAHQWIIRAQKSLAVKNKVRKDLWQELVDVINWDPIPSSSRKDYVRIPKSSFVSLQTFCLIDGKGADNISSDQLLNFCTTLDDLRSRLPVVQLIHYVNQRVSSEIESLPVTARREAGRADREEAEAKHDTEAGPAIHGDRGGQ